MDGLGPARPVRYGPSVHVSTNGMPGFVVGPRTAIGGGTWARGGRRLKPGPCPPPPSGWEWLRELAVQAGALRS